MHCTAQTLDGHYVDIIATGFGARVLQHEIDHLNGVLFIDKLAQPSGREAKPAGAANSEEDILPPLPTSC